MQCVVRGNVHISATEGIGNCAGREESRKAQMLRKCMKDNWNYQRGGVGVLGNIPLVEEILIIYRTTIIALRSKLAKCMI